MNLPSCRPIAPPLTTLPPGAEGSTVGRLVSPGADDDQTDALYAIYRDDETDAVASSVEQSDLAAEEEAVHLVPESSPDVDADDDADL